MLFRHGPPLYVDTGDTDCPDCELAYHADSWVEGKGHLHPKLDKLQRVFMNYSKGKYLPGKLRRARRSTGQK